MAGKAYSRLPIRHMQGNVHWFLSVLCVYVCVCVTVTGEERGQDAGCSGWRNSKLRSSKVSSSGKTQNHRPSPGGSDQKADWKK